MKFKKVIIWLIIIVVALLGIKFGVKKYAFPYKHKEVIDKYSKEYNLDPLFVLSIIKAESKFNPNAHSHKDAFGLMQITESTGKWIAEQMGMKNYSTDMLYNEETNIKMGCWYLNNLNDEFGDRDLVISAYNAGRGNVNKWLKDQNYSKNGKDIHYIPFPETKNYVDKVNIYYKVYKYLYE
ncbi:lytic transglycosylase domain-containing protein [Clostridium sardiniense]|uniref:Lytic transglycosylase domain-containing protein n=1 Tax=Clostridium sardiniense TaxID=29369 RepID=A0ABS7L0I5_CLOSR|nr:lytic transglycosylase domain-containing protein [Clostridium sardiniense]MBM7835022.1 soluble lytic murein transglycosylase [Clostridium sardiniense]MBY0756578.1 lytic transglycosylase domain-containing protein [Clostridium sardiniense]MDQ0460327.1 soluble lytic murein transglycosylase [Clostridium sardiniense]